VPGDAISDISELRESAAESEGECCAIQERETSAAAKTLCCVGEVVIVAGRVAVLAVVVNNTVAYKKDAVWCVVTFLGLSQIWRG